MSQFGGKEHGGMQRREEETFRLPDGGELSGQPARLLRILSQRSSKDSPLTQREIARELAPGKELRNVVPTVSRLINDWSAILVESGSGLHIVRTDPEPQRREAGYYMEADSKFELPGGQEVIGKPAELLQAITERRRRKNPPTADELENEIFPDLARSRPISARTEFDNLVSETRRALAGTNFRLSRVPFKIKREIAWGYTLEEGKRIPDKEETQRIVSHEISPAQTLPSPVEERFLQDPATVKAVEEKDPKIRDKLRGSLTLLKDMPELQQAASMAQVSLATSQVGKREDTLRTLKAKSFNEQFGQYLRVDTKGPHKQPLFTLEAVAALLYLASEGAENLSPREKRQVQGIAEEVWKEMKKKEQGGRGKQTK